jgi:hypothetical protein
VTVVGDALRPRVLHGHLDLVRCMACWATSRRADFQDRMVRLNAAWAELDAAA